MSLRALSKPYSSQRRNAGQYLGFRQDLFQQGVRTWGGNDARRTVPFQCLAYLIQVIYSFRDGRMP